VKLGNIAVKTAIGAAGIAGAGVFGAGTAVAAPPAIQHFGTSEPLFDGPRVTSYTRSATCSPAMWSSRATCLMGSSIKLT
jgi:hypothetical protein